ncbi:hypothetical protein [Paenibacillus sp. IITD108]|uniref:hypothetical protein n=1 Tax=Paenibacillus sp. IITD108 TaxID=3116649 RepID=UPI002F3E5DE1
MPLEIEGTPANSLNEHSTNEYSESDSEEETQDEIDFFDGEPIYIDPLEIIERYKNGDLYIGTNNERKYIEDQSWRNNFPDIVKKISRLQ